MRLSIVLLLLLQTCVFVSAVHSISSRNKSPGGKTFFGKGKGKAKWAKKIAFKKKKSKSKFAQSQKPTNSSGGKKFGGKKFGGKKYFKKTAPKLKKFGELTAKSAIPTQIETPITLAPKRGVAVVSPKYVPSPRSYKNKYYNKKRSAILKEKNKEQLKNNLKNQISDDSTSDSFDLFPSNLIPPNQNIITGIKKSVENNLINSPKDNPEAFDDLLSDVFLGDFLNKAKHEVPKKIAGIPPVTLKFSNLDEFEDFIGSPGLLDDNKLDQEKKIKIEQIIDEIGDKEEFDEDSWNWVSAEGFQVRNYQNQHKFAPALYVNELDYEVTATPKLLKSWLTKNKYWFPYRIYNESYWHHLIDEFSDEDDSEDLKSSDTEPIIFGSKNKIEEKIKLSPEQQFYLERKFSDSENDFTLDFDPVIHSSFTEEQKICLDAHNFYRSNHVKTPKVSWSKFLADQAQVWANYLAKYSSPGPDFVEHNYRRTKNWPHSDRKGQRKYNDWVGFKRDLEVGEVVEFSWIDDDKYQNPCLEMVDRIYNQIFNLDLSNPIKSTASSKNNNNDVGQLTQLLWIESTEVGCGWSKVNFSSNKFSTIYVICQYNKQGNNIKTMLDNYKPLKKQICTTFDQISGKNKCQITKSAAFDHQLIEKSPWKYRNKRVNDDLDEMIVLGDCISFDSEMNMKKKTCDCHLKDMGKFSRVKGKYVYPYCKGRCIVNCRKSWLQKKNLRETCTGSSFCTCTEYGAFCG